MTLKQLVLTLLISIILGTVAVTAPVQAQGVTSDLLARINNLRASLGLEGYVLNAALSVAAQNQASWMVTTVNVSHTWDDGTTVRDRTKAAGYGSSWVSENIYMGTNATVDSAWNFWINSPVHYAGLTNSRYRDVGIGTATGAGGQSFVLVFGNPGGAYLEQQSSGQGSGQQSEPAGPPPYVLGNDPYGNIMHEVQPGDTLGDIALIYGYTWDDIPTMLALNGLSEEEGRLLEIGSVFLVPPHAGTYTPTPDEAVEESTAPPPLRPTNTPWTPIPTVTPAIQDSGPTPITESTQTQPLADRDATVETAVAATLTAIAVSPTPVTEVAIESGDGPVVRSLPTATPDLTQPVLAADTTQTDNPTGGGGLSPFLMVLVAIQVIVLAVASFEFIRRLRR